MCEHTPVDLADGQRVCQLCHAYLGVCAKIAQPPTWSGLRQRFSYKDLKKMDTGEHYRQSRAAIDWIYSHRKRLTREEPIRQHAGD